jgi:hypothetical protein
MRAASWALLVALFSGCLSSTTPDDASPSPRVWAIECFGIQDWPDACTSPATLGSGPANENFLAVNPTNPLNIVVGAKNYDPKASDCVWAGVSSSHDGGRTWSSTFVGGNRQARADPNHPLHGFNCVTDPMLKFAPDGTLYYVVEAYGRVPRTLAEQRLPSPMPASGGSAIFLTVSRDGGLTFPEAEWTKVIERQEAYTDGLDDRTCLVVAPDGALHMGWSVQGKNQGLFASSRDQGKTWSTPIMLSSSGGYPFPMCPTLAPDGAIYVTWADWKDGFINVVKSTTNGESFEGRKRLFQMPTIQIAPNAQFNIISQPFLAVDSSGGPEHGTLYLVFPQRHDGQFDIMVSFSRDHGDTWSRPDFVDWEESLSDQFHPTVVVDDEGVLHITYFDRRYEAGNRLVDLTWSWGTPMAGFQSKRVTQTSFDGDLGNHQEGHAFLGDYNGLAFQNGTVYASFSDNRRGSSDVALALFSRT